MSAKTRSGDLLPFSSRVRGISTPGSHDAALASEVASLEKAAENLALWSVCDT